MTFNKDLSIFFLAAMMLPVLASCGEGIIPEGGTGTKQEDLYPSAMNNILLEINTVPESHTWHTGDKLSVFDGTSDGNSLFISIGEGNDVQFTGLVDKESESIVCLSPYDADARMEGNVLRTNINTEQIVRDNSASGILVASANGHSVSMQCITAEVSFSLNTDDITTVEFSGKSGESLAGGVDILLEGTPHMSASSQNGEKTIRILPGNGQCFNAGTYSFVSIPTTLASGWQVRLKNKEGKVTHLESANPVSMVTDKVLDLGTIDQNLSWKNMIETDVLLQFKTDATLYDNTATTGNGESWPFLEDPYEKSGIFSTGAGNIFSITSPNSSFGTSLDPLNGFRVESNDSDTYISLPVMKYARPVRISLSMGEKTGHPFITDSNGIVVPGGTAKQDSQSCILYVWNLVGTEMNTEYHLCLGSGKGIDLMQLNLTYETDDSRFVSSAKLEEISGLKSIDGTTVSLKGSIVTNEFDPQFIECGFEYKKTSQAEYTSVSCLTDGPDFSCTLSGLSKGEEYICRAWGCIVGNDRVYSDALTFKTIGSLIINIPFSNDGSSFKNPFDSSVNMGGGKWVSPGVRTDLKLSDTYGGYTLTFSSTVGYMTNSGGLKWGSAKGNYLLLPIIEGFILKKVTIGSSSNQNILLGIYEEGGTKCPAGGEPIKTKIASKSSYTWELNGTVSNKRYGIYVTNSPTSNFTMRYLNLEYE